MKQHKPYSGSQRPAAAALKYEEGKDAAPRVTALGRGELAQRIVKEAERNRVQVVQDEGLTQVLHRLSIGDEIPEALYQVVAEILTFVYSMDGKAGRRYPGGR